MVHPTAGPIQEEKKGKFSFFSKSKDDNAKPKKEKKAKKEKKEKAPKKEKEPSNKNMFGKEKKKPRAEYQAEIDTLKAELHETRIRYAELARWAKQSPVN